MRTHRLPIIAPCTAQHGVAKWVADTDKPPVFTPPLVNDLLERSMNLLLNERVVVVELIIRLLIIIDTATGDHSRDCPRVARNSR